MKRPENELSHGVEMIEGHILEAKLFARVDVQNSILQLTFHQY